MATTLYHGTDRDFDAFDDSFIGSGNGHVNSNLGLWFAVVPDWVGGFGGRVIEAEVELGRSFPLTVKELYRLSHPSTGGDGGVEFFREMRRRLMEEGYDSIAIVEAGGSVDMHVVLTAASVAAIRDMAAAPAPR
jgi:hypothetical protein